MRKVNKLGVGLMSSALVFTSSISPMFATETTVIDEAYSKPTVVYGGGLSTDERSQTLDILGISNTNSVYEMSVTGDDVLKYLGYQGDTSSLISSVVVTKKSSGGVQVNILTDNITRITETEYANAAITAGATNVQIDVGAVTNVTGESALTGVYKALEANGETIDTERTQVAQEELETTNEIAQNNADNSNFNSSNLDQALIDIKQQLADLKESQGSTATTEQIQEIVVNVINNYNLGDILSENDINSLISFAQKYQNTSAIDSEEVSKQLDNLSSQLSGLIDTAKAEGWWDKIVNFFVGIYNSIVQ